MCAIKCQPWIEFRNTSYANDHLAILPVSQHQCKVPPIVGYCYLKQLVKLVVVAEFVRQNFAWKLEVVMIFSPSGFEKSGQSSCSREGFQSFRFLLKTLHLYEEPFWQEALVRLGWSVLVASEDGHSGQNYWQVSHLLEGESSFGCKKKMLPKVVVRFHPRNQHFNAYPPPPQDRCIATKHTQLQACKLQVDPRWTKHINGRKFHNWLVVEPPHLKKYA